MLVKRLRLRHLDFLQNVVSARSLATTRAPARATAAARRSVSFRSNWISPGYCEGTRPSTSVMSTLAVPSVKCWVHVKVVIADFFP
jgi:hypothetical protein